MLKPAYKDATDTSSEKSEAIWGNCNVDANPGRYIVYENDFNKNQFLTNNKTEQLLGDLLAYTGLTASSDIIDAVLSGGAVTLESSTDNEGAAIRTLPAFKISSASGRLWFEARLKMSNITDSKYNVFCGLAETTTLSNAFPITTSDAMADKNFVGFQRVFADGDMLDTTYKADGVTQVTVGSDVLQCVADTFVKVGMFFDGSRLYFYKDGAQLADSKAITGTAGTDFPSDTILGFVLATMNGSAQANSVTIDWVKIAQERS